MPQVLGRYHIISELGRGGMGVVYKAVDPKLERFIAIKCLSEELSSDEITVTRFLREARNVAALNHPHIAQIFLADEDEGKPYFVMEYIDGESLAERLAREKRLMPEQALRIVSECAEALKAAHEENIIHRDVKPGNIMLDRRGRTVLTDFGIASIVHPDQEPRSGQYIMGTPGYLPPEVIKGQPADHRGDLFALGAVLYEMLAGRRLVPGRGIEDTARTLLAKDFPELGDLDDQVDDFTFGVLGRMIAPDPDRRFQNYDDLLAGLRREQAAADASPESGSELDPTRLAGAAASRDADAPVVPNADAPETVDVDAEAAEPPATAVSPPPAGRNRAAKYSATAAVLLALCLVGFGMVRLIPERWDQVTALFQSADDTAVAPANETTPNPDPPDSRRDDAGQLSAVAGRHEDTRIAGSRRTALPATDSTETNRPVEPVAAGGDEQSAADPAVGARSTEDFLASALRLTA
jgi:serine/threonine-protein kinase